MANLIGNREPTFLTIPEGDTARGDQAVEFARFIGMSLFPWQEDMLRDMCRTKDDGKFAARECVVSIPRQNGKGEVLVARELAGVYLFGEKTILHTAHFLDTARDAMRRTWEVMENCPELMEWFPGKKPMFSRTNGKEEIRFPNGTFIYYRTRTRKVARGLSVDLTILDECYDLPTEIYNAIASVSTARQNAQTIFISSPVDRYEHLNGDVFSAKRWAAKDGAEGMYYAEWCAHDDDDPYSLEAFKHSNPSLTEDGPGAQLGDIKQKATAAKASESLRAGFLVETLGVGNWVPRDGEEEDTNLFNEEKISRMVTNEQKKIKNAAVCIEVSPDRAKASVAVAGLTDDGGYHSAISFTGPFNLQRTAQTLWQVIKAVDPQHVVIDPKTPGAVLIAPLKNRGIDVHELKMREFVQASDFFLQLEAEDRVSISDSDVVRTALDSIQLRDNNSGALERYSGEVTTVTAAAIAMWASESLTEQSSGFNNMPTNKVVQRIVKNEKRKAFGG